jgi:alpha-L-rhamnosidase
MSHSKRILIGAFPSPPPTDVLGRRTGQWPAWWVGDGPGVDDTPRVVAYRCAFQLEKSTSFRVHVSADERYELYLDGHRLGRGPERGDRHNWFFESYTLDLPAGSHVITARVWSLGERGPSPYAQISIRHAFLLAAEGVDDDLLNTGVASWQCKPMPGYETRPHGEAWGCGAKVRIVGSEFDWQAMSGTGEGWRDVCKLARAVDRHANDQPHRWILRPAVLPAMCEDLTHVGTPRLVSDATAFPFHDDPYKPQPAVRAADHLQDEADAWSSLLRGQGSVTIPPHTSRRILIDLDDYYCAYPDLTTTGGAGSLARISWAESMYERLPIAEKKEWIGHMAKGHRDQIEGKFFHGVTDEFLPDGGAQRNFSTLWWEAGRFVQVLIRTEDQPLTIDALAWRVTHYPFEFTSRFSCSDDRMAAVHRISMRALTMGSHEHYTDSPYYEQIQYVGDTRLEALTTYVTTADARLPRKAVELIGESRQPDGAVQSRYPSRVTQHTWGFNLWWVAMAHDHFMWRGDVDFLRGRLHAVRSAIDSALRCVEPGGLVIVPRQGNLNFIDWVPAWDRSRETPGAFSAVYTLQTAHVLQLAAQLEEAAGEPEIAQRNRRRARELIAAAIAQCWNESRGILSDDPSQKHFSEHAQIMALLCDELPVERRSRIESGLLGDPNLARATIYFTHYLFEVLHQMGRGERIVERLSTWFDLLKVGLRTLPEMPEPTRSDCHAWGAHVVYHSYASILGIRPTRPGMKSVRIRPMLGSWHHAAGSVPCDGGELSVDVCAKSGRLSGEVRLPAGVDGVLEVNGESVPLTAGQSRRF